MTGLSKELALAQKLAKDAGKLVLDLQKTATVSQKPKNEGPVTNADLLADEFLCQELKKAFPSDQIISEESYHSNIILPQKGRVWYIDPIDGTSDYVRQGKDYAVMIGLSIDHQPTLGVVYQPRTNTLWRGMINSKKILSQRVDDNQQVVDLNIIDRHLPEDGPIIVISRNHPSKFVDYFAKELKASKIIKKGSLGLKLTLIADGEADFYVTSSRKMKLWDSCAPGAILRAAGGKLCAITGEELYFSDHISHRIPLFAASPNCNHWFKTTFTQALENWTKR